MSAKEYVRRTEALLQPILDEHGFDLWSVDWVKEGSQRCLRACIDKEGGITIDDCELVSRALSSLLDEEDFISENYILEVSSPGLERPLKKDRDFERSIGKIVELRLFRAIDGQKGYDGVLRAFDADTVTLELGDGSLKNFERPAISRIRWKFTD